MRFSGRGVRMSSTVRATGNQAFGFAAAISVIGAIISAIARRYSGSATPRCARRALSNSANVSHALNTSCATSTGWNGASQGNGRFSVGAKLAEYFSPCLRSAACVASASAPTMHTRSTSPARMRAAGARRRVLHQGLRRRAADPGVVATLRRGAEAIGESRGGVVVLPGLAIHDLERVELLEQARTDAAVVGSRARNVLPHEERLGRARP